MDSQTFFTIILAAIFASAIGIGAYAMSIAAIEPRLARSSVFWAWTSSIILFVWYGGTNDMPRIGRYVIAAGLAALVTVLCCMALDYIATREKIVAQTASVTQPTAPAMPSVPTPPPPPAANSTDESLPGAAFAVVFSMTDMAVKKRQYLFEYATPEGATVAFYISKSDRFTFLATDRNGESYPIEVPLGKDGIPILRPVQLYCDVGSGSNYSFMRVFVNGRQVERRDLQFPIDMGSRQWTDGTLGANLGKSNNASFDIVEFMLFTTTLNAHDLTTLTQNEMAAFNITDNPTNFPSSPAVIPAQSTPP